MVILDKNDIQNSFIAMLEKVANGKINILNFGGDMIFTRGEIHIIKRIGDNEGIYSSELAQLMGVTRAVSNKTVNKLENKDFILKKNNSDNLKIKKLYLTQKGKLAYDLHEKYHEDSDSEFIEYISSLSEEDSIIIKKFLNKANTVIENHF